jgi:hypothetical protein
VPAEYGYIFARVLFRKLGAPAHRWWMCEGSRPRDFRIDPRCVVALTVCGVSVRHIVVIVVWATLCKTLGLRDATGNLTSPNMKHI